MRFPRDLSVSMGQAPAAHRELISSASGREQPRVDAQKHAERLIGQRELAKDESVIVAIHRRRPRRGRLVLSRLTGVPDRSFSFLTVQMSTEGMVAQWRGSLIVVRKIWPNRCLRRSVARRGDDFSLV